MASAMRKAVEAGYEARQAGRIARRTYARASSPEEGVAELAGSPSEPGFGLADDGEAARRLPARRPSAADPTVRRRRHARWLTPGTELERALLDELAAQWRAGWHGGGFEALLHAGRLLRGPGRDRAAGRGRGARPPCARAAARVPGPARSRRRRRRSGAARTPASPGARSGTQRGDIGTLLPATDRPVALHGLHYVELSDGLVRRARGFFDLYDATTQLGLLPSRGGLGETALLMLRGFGLRRRPT